MRALAVMIRATPRVRLSATATRWLIIAVLLVLWEVAPRAG